MDGEAGQAQMQSMAAAPSGGAAPGEAEQVGKWLKKIEAAKRHWKVPFERMEVCQQIAAFGAFKEWLEDESRYVAPILNRHVNQAVSQLYAKNPKAETRRKRRLLHAVWDGTQEQIADVGRRFLMGDPAAVEEMVALDRDIKQAQAQENMLDRAAKTLDILYSHQLQEQPFPFKTMLKALVRRTKVNAVGWIKINFLRQMEMRPEVSGMAEDTVSKMKTIERLQADLAAGTVDEPEAAQAQLASLMADVGRNQDRVVREQMVYDFPRSRDIILDPCTRHLKTLYGCNWLAHQFDLSSDHIRDIYGVDLSAQMSEVQRSAMAALDRSSDETTYRIYEVQDKYTQQVFVVAEGYDRFLKAPAEPDVWVETFFNVFPLVFNEIEHDKEIYPPSDVWAARHMQFEYNRSREGLREHRMAARPYWLARKGRLEATEKERLKNHAAHEIVEVMPEDPMAPVSSVVEKGPTAAIDPNLYEVETLFSDVLRTVGTQEANLGGTSGATATESSIAESSRTSSIGDNVDDLDDFLSLLARISGQLLFQEFSKERVMEIVGPGAVWPDMKPARKQIADEIALEVKAGSSGRPNQAARLANMERAWPALSMLPGINPEPLASVYADLLDIDFADLNRRGALSILSQNAMASAPVTGPSPQEQGPAGASNAKQPPGEPAGPQPAYPTGTESQPLVSSAGL